MRHFVLLLAASSACTSEDPTAATFHGTVDSSITHVMAVSPAVGEIQRVLVPTEGNSFSVTVATGQPWTFVFVDANKVGSAMVAGVLRANTLESFLPRVARDIDLGDISFDGRDATMGGSSARLDAALGLHRTTNATLGGLDDLALRYANPDVDSDGVIDSGQAHGARLDLHADYQFAVDGRVATADDFIANWSEVGYDHVGTSIYARFPDEIGPIDRDDASVTFEQPFAGVAVGGIRTTAAAGQPITDLTFGDSQTVGVYARPGHDVPSGNYQFRSGEHTLDFTLVHPPKAAAMTDSMHQVFPRIQFIPVDPACTADCVVATIRWAWERRSESGWVALSREEAVVLQPSATLDLLLVGGEHRRFELPVGVPSGEMPWNPDEGTNRTTSVTYLQLSFQTRPGMKTYAWLGDGAAGQPAAFGATHPPRFQPESP